VRDLKGRYPHLAVFGELKTGQSPISADILVLLADSSTEGLDLDLAGFLSKLAGGDMLTLEGVKRPEQAHRE